MPKTKLAIADDQVLFRESISSSINSTQEFEVALQAGNGQELLDELDKQKDNIEIILCDLNMPVLNGKETTLLLKEKYPDTKIIIVSFHNEPAYIIAMVEIGINAYLDKNSSLEEVVECIKSVNDKGFYFNEHTMNALKQGAAGKNLRKVSLDPSESLTERELEVLDLICKEYKTSEIAEQLFLSAKTVEGHRNNLLSKTNSRNVAGLVVFAFKHQLVTTDI